MFRMISIATMALASLLPAVGTAQPQAKQTTYALIVCESPRGRESFCQVDTRRGVYLKRDLNGNCRIGRTWGYDYNGIWVRGCNGEFEIGRRGDGYGWGSDYRGTDYLVCESRDFKYTRCEVDDTRFGVRLTNQISRVDCVEGRTWGFDRRQIWVDQGCAGEFAIGDGGGGSGVRPPPPPPPGPIYDDGDNRGQTFLCESKDNRRRTCPVDLSGRRGGDAVAILRNASSVTCREGINWGYDARGVWVDGGCRAEFRIIRLGGNGPGYPGNPGPGNGRPPAGDVRYVTCESRDYKRSFCEVGRDRDVRVRRQISKTRCIEGETWDYQRGRIWVDQGCGAEFEVIR